MTAKQYLSNLIMLDTYISSKLDTLEMLHAMSTQKTQRLKEVNVQTSGDLYRHEEIMAEAVDLENDIHRAIKKLLSLKKEAMSLIERVDNNRYRTLLTLRYINCRSWLYIAEFMGYQDIRGATKLHGSALQAFDQVLEKCTC